jgi:ribose transport system ATP-binding protein
MTRASEVTSITDPSAVGPDLEDVVLEVRNLTKVYGATAALQHVSFTVAPGEIVGLLGENGAGKSTLVKILAGLETADVGHAKILGIDATHDGCSAAFIHQDLGLVGELSVAENIALTTGYARRVGLIDWRRTRQRARQVLDALDVDIDPDADVDQLSLAEQASVAIARALAEDARLVVLDEPSAGLSAHEVNKLFGVLDRLRRRGVSCILISHRLDEIFDICDRVVVLRNGRLVADEVASNLTKGELIELIVGGAFEGHHHEDLGVLLRGKECLSLSDLVVEHVGPVSFAVHGGEVLGLTGLAGSGHVELVEGLAGMTSIEQGSVLLDGMPYRPRSRADALRRGVAFVPGDRNRDGLAGGMSVLENLNLNPVGRSVLSFLDSRERCAARSVVEEYDVRPQRIDVEIDTLSGGNAQKVMVARELQGSPRVASVCEPTAGVDVGARKVIHGKLTEAAANGTAVIVASSDFEEITDLCDRVIVLRRGRVAAVLSRRELSPERLLEVSHG